MNRVIQPVRTVRAARALREPVDITFYAVNGFLALMNLIVAVVGPAGDAAVSGGAAATSGSARHVAVAAAFAAACALPTLLSTLEDRITGRLARGLTTRVMRFVRTFYVHAFYGLYFAEVILLSQAVWGATSLDGLLAGIEETLFGFQPAVAFSEALSHLPAVNELFFLGYFSYYLILTTGFWIMFLHGRDEAARRAVFITITSFALLYVWYVFFPVQGPKYFFESLNRSWYSEFEGYVFVPLMRAVFDRMTLAGAAFPSSHVAIGLIAVLLLRPHLPRLFRLYLAFFVLLCASTVYIYAHYVLDVIAGLAVAPVLLWTAKRLYRRAQ
ncbi:MAG: phosphatase PAP2 family protein [Spirochaetes bacterium]|jgi:membrane-associated phospholipid phosphatase|nr:phosphatase PAP2 family protein [Spirochaetota bacterium]